MSNGFKIKRKEDGGILLSRLISGKDLLNIVCNAHAYAFDHDELNSKEEADLIGEFLEIAQDWGDLCDNLESGKRVEVGFDLTQKIKELEAAGFFVFGFRETQLLEGKDGATDWHVAIINVIRNNNKEIIKLNVSDILNKITEVTRREIIDKLMAENLIWAGRLSESEFLSRLYDLQNIPSSDHRFKNASGDIYQHRDSFVDWSDDWIFYDDRFNLLRERDEIFLRFLCETVHPVVRPDTDEANKLIEIYNEELKKDGWEIVKKSEISGKPVFTAREIGERVEIFEEPTGWPKVDRQMSEVRLRLREANTEEQFQAVGLLCREVLISLAQTVYDPKKHHSPDGKTPSNTDAGRMLEAYISAELAGKSHEEMRSHAKASLKLALALQHKRSADYKMAASCAEATASVVNQVAIISGRR
jgi:hypothetical protein